MPFSMLPKELKVIPHWINWNAELEQGSIKLTKKPINSRTGKYASPTDSSTWSTFDEALLAAPYCSGIGFVLSESCPYSVIDLDDPYELTPEGILKHSNPEIITQRQQLIASVFDSYQEVSPSGKGLHIWCKGKISSGRRREAIEVYSSGRYMTVTGQCFKPGPIQDHQDKLTQLWAEMEAKEIITSKIDKPEVATDTQILTFASQAVNGQKFIDLYEGRWSLYYPSQSEADFALANIIAYYTQNRQQVIRIFQSSTLGQRKKSMRDLKNYIIDRVFDNLPPDCNMDELKNNLEQQFAVKQQELTVKNQVEVVKEPEPADNIDISKYSKTCIFKFDPPPGLCGTIAKFIYDAAPRPVAEIAIAGAIGVMSGICGRSYNISGTGLNQYVLILAMTGAGKESCASGIDKLITATSKTVPAVNEFIGPGEIASPQALMKYMNKTSKCFMSLVGEFGMKFKQLCSERASSNDLGLKRIFLDLYNKSGSSSILKPLIYSDKDKNTESIKSPAFSMLGETTPETFYENLTSNLISDGLLPRFTIIEYHGKRPQLNKNHLESQPSNYLLEQFSALCAYSLQLNNGNNVLQVQLDEQSQKMFNDFDKHCDYQINTASNDVTRQLWNRAHIKALKLAAILAVGCNYINPVINTECATWALQLIVNDVTNLLSRFESGAIGIANVQNEQTLEIKKAFKKYIITPWDELQKTNGATLLTYNAKIIPHAFLSGFCRQRAAFKNDRLGPIPALTQAIKSMIECDEIRELSPQDKNKQGISVNTRCYMVSGMKI